MPRRQPKRMRPAGRGQTQPFTLVPTGVNLLFSICRSLETAMAAREPVGQSAPALVDRDCTGWLSWPLDGGPIAAPSCSATPGDADRRELVPGAG